VFGKNNQENNQENNQADYFYQTEPKIRGVVAALAALVNEGGKPQTSGTTTFVELFEFSY
jgi:hypothetical protein